MTGRDGRIWWERVRAGAALALLLVGCSATREECVPVEGRITVKGQPLSAGTVVFHPNASRGNASKREPRATISADQPGRYRLTTDDREGAPLGWYRVTVFALQPLTRENSMRPPEWLADPKYADEQTSGLEVNVVKDPAAGAYDLDLRPPRGR